MKTPYTIEDVIDSNDLAHDDHLTINAEIDTVDMSATIKSIVHEFTDVNDERVVRGRKLTDFRDETLKIFEQKVIESYLESKQSGEDADFAYDSWKDNQLEGA